MSNDNTGLIVGGLIVAYLYTKRQQQAVAYTTTAKGAPLSMPGSVGAGIQQVKVGAIAGFLSSLASMPWNNTSQTVFPTPSVQNYGAVQDVVNEPADLQGMLDAQTDTTWWA